MAAHTPTSPTRGTRTVRLVDGRIEGPELLTIAEVAALFGIRRETVWSWRRNNGFPDGIVVGTTRRIPREQVETWLHQRTAR